MFNIEIEKRKAIPLSRIYSAFNFSNYLNDHIYPLSDEVTNAKVIILDNTVVPYIVDWFGGNAHFYTLNGQLLATVKCDEQALYFWLLQFDDYVEIKEPISLKEKIKNHLRHVLNRY